MASTKYYKHYWTEERIIEESHLYSSMTEFCRCNKSAYSAAYRKGLLQKMTWLEPTERHFWCKEEVIAIAKQYTTLKDFASKANGACQYARKKGFLKELSWLTHGNRAWSKESVINESHRYASRSEFARECVGAYMYAKKHNMLERMTWLELQVRPRWTKEECIEESKKYTTRRDFSKNSSGAYTAACDNGWIEEMTWLALLVRPQWTKEECIEVSKNFSSRSEYQDKANGSYQAARSNGWLDDMPWLQRPMLQELKHLAIHCVYVYIDDENNACYVGRTNRLSIRDREHRKPYRKPDSLKRYFDSIGREIPRPIVLKEKLMPEESQYWEDYYVKEYYKKGYTILNRAKTGVNVGSLGGGYIKWNKENTLLESKKYRRFSDFGKGSPSAYQAAIHNDWLKDMTWIEYDQLPNGYWTKERVIEESKKYTKRIEMEAGSPAAYSAALKNGWSADLPLEYRRVGKNYYTKEKVFELSKECTYRAQFKAKYSRAYVIARKNKWLDEMPWLVLRRK